MDTREFVTYELAVQLKKLGFNEPCLSYFDVRLEHQIGNFDFTESGNYGESSSVLSPLYQQAFRWFRDEHRLFMGIGVDQTVEPKFYYTITEYYEDEAGWEWKDGFGNSSLYRTYAEAELACLAELIEIVEQTKN